jgi:hypothetical protein
LAASTPGTSGDDWKQIIDARCRSATSRAYYAVFLALKNRVLQERPTFAFPELDAHSIVRRAIEHMYGANHALPLALKGLLERRKKSDYQLDGPGDPEAGVAPLLASAKAALATIAGWNSQQVQQFIGAIERYRSANYAR